MNLRVILNSTLFSLTLFTSVQSNAADSYLGGNVTNMTSYSGGLLIMLDSGVPTNCTGTSYGWMLIRAENKVMIAVVLTMFAMGKKSATIYTSGILGSGYCEINQYDPAE